MPLAVSAAPTRARCVACRGPTSVLGGREGFSYAACARCGTLQLDPLPTQAELDALYGAETFSEGYFDPVDLQRRYGPYYELVADLVASSGRPDGLVVDFGCGWGGVGEQLARRGIEQLSLDLSAKSVETCRERGLRAEVGDLQFFGDQQGVLSAVTAAFVFEHLVRFDSWIGDVRRLLRPGGVVVVLIPTPNLVRPIARALGRLFPDRELPAFDKTLTPPWHTVIFSPRGLIRLMARHGFDVVRVAASPTSRADGVGGAVRRVLNPLMSVGTAWFGHEWPLALGHAFVFRVQR